MKYRTRMISLVCIDSAVVLLSIYMSYFIINPFSGYILTIPILKTMILTTSITLLITHHAFSYIFGLYRSVWKYASMEELVGLFYVVTSSVIITALVQKITFQNVYFQGLSVTYMLNILLLGFVRFWWRFSKTISFELRTRGIRPEKAKRTLIIGAGSTGRMLLQQLKDHPTTDLQPVAFLDDNENVQRLQVGGLPVAGTVTDLQKVVKRFNIDHVVIAIPSLSKHKLHEIVTEAKKVCKDVQILPMIGDLASGKISVSEIRDVSIEDLLGREPVVLDIKGIEDKIESKTILITGAGGSIGSELCRQLCLFKPKTIILLGHGENSIYSIEMELRKKHAKEIEFFTEIADVQDRGKMFDILFKHRPAFVFHAAAHKHVPLMERNPEAAVKNNIFGTKNVAEAADAAGVNTFVLVSTDKAVNPTSVMGSTKRVAEIIIQNLARNSQTRFVAVRFGNVLGSRGSVVPLFKKQIAAGGPVTVTHPEMTRYFMTIPEAARLVIQAGTLARGGEIFVLDMGESVKIVDLAKNLIKLSGFTEDEIKIEYSGMRPGEKLYEEILNKDEIHPEKVYPKIYIGKATQENAEDILKEISMQMDDPEKLRETLLEIANRKRVTQKKILSVT
ncbi:polysaccharide biosynthesis protein [Neobacillus sp. MM2021_6]|uniref:polysaccharide biosynthesis protein n=1 Tax=Bacillaceae TaxID=186817 RepID=UPI00140E5183|nr:MULTISPECIES: nucleoside-diphosphate sugar epimerase/dehydratase [Bacillaceae]MBO0961647.1 polysaccharide biosynthesis protein [Neobacillus sp. MM2021_6]NHC21243.1 polysaccharide biosynthesis protein [Bacillus sp. MM2020_4]